jgi:hypothetical protein
VGKSWCRIRLMDPSGMSRPAPSLRGRCGFDEQPERFEVSASRGCYGARHDRAEYLSPD